MSVIKIAILGFGTVGEGVYRIIHSHAAELKKVLGKKVEVTAILIKDQEKKRNISDDILITSDFEDIMKLDKLDVVIEAIVGKESPFLFLKKSIERKCHIITANKEMFAHHGEELQKLAEKNNVSVGFEATVAGGIPVIQTIRTLLKVNRVFQLQGILNGTSNFILTEMREKKQSFTEALLQAQENGYAEADPTNDVEGFDAFYKTMILCRIAFGEEPNWEEVQRQGITSITSELIAAAEKYGLRFKHFAQINRDGSEIIAVVKPVLVNQNHPFYHVEGVQNAVNVCSDIVGCITLQGPGAGMFPTSSAVIEDLVYVCQNQLSDITNSIGFVSDDKKTQGELEYWFVQGVGWKVPKGITIVDQTVEGIFILKAAKRDLEQLKNNKEVLCYPIVGEITINNFDSVTV
ncbi:homoserine dehydrogenase [Neobacillus niacini]|uniref:homoserine dehydrogenase n=1 Tax=Neobacillus niacini TaxID=86668 RepID=UPI0007ABB626|nr:homoserine dehydrogenase [Neobacillus niacini]MEC1523866.1 homoserine dehydrogenase [Neobacillus niacini]